MQSSKNPNILYPYQNPQTKSSQKTDYFGLRRPYRKTIIICGQITTADCTDTELYLKDTADVINFIEKTKVLQDTILVS